MFARVSNLWKHAGILSVVISLAIAAGCHDSTSQGNGYCEFPIEVSGEFDPRAPGFVILFFEEIDLDSELMRFVQVYENLEVGSVFDSLNGFFALMDDDTLERIRCEPAIETISRDAIAMTTWLQ